MNSERIIELFNEAAEKLPEEREAFLAASCRDQPELRQHLERLLRAGQAAAGNFLNQAASGAMRAQAEGLSRLVVVKDGLRQGGRQTGAAALLLIEIRLYLKTAREQNERN